MQVNGQLHDADRIIIATGSSTRPLPVDGMDRVKWHTNRTILDLEEATESMIVIGAGPLGLEFAQMFTHFGTRVTVLEAMDQVLPREEPEIAGELRRVLRRRASPSIPACG